MFELVKTSTKDGIYLHGLFSRGDKDKYAVLNVHGYEEDFYSNGFVPVIAEALKENGHTFLSVETRGTASEKEFDKTDGSSAMLGSHYEVLKQAYLDIDAWVEFLIENGYHNIVLQGHSIGTVKAVRYMAEGSHIKYIKKIILLSPFDVHSVAHIMSNGKYKDYLKIAKDKEENGFGEGIIDSELFELRISYQTLLSWLTMDHFGKMFNFADKENNFMVLNKLDIPVKVVVGKNDEYINPLSKKDDSVQEAVDIMKLNIKDCVQKVIAESGSRFKNKEHELAQEVILFLEE